MLNETSEHYPKTLKRVNTFKLTKIGLHLKYWDRNEYEYDQIAKEYLQILKSYKYDWETSEFVSEMPKNYPISSVAILAMAIHELITLLDDPGYLGFNYVRPDHEAAAITKEKLKKLLEGKFYISFEAFV